jgi:type II secretory pathway pseudopilin PulG
VELAVSLSLVAVAAALLFQSIPKASRERSAEARADDIQTIHMGLERIKRSLETARAILLPTGQAGKPGRSLVFRDVRNRLTVWTVQGGDLVQSTFSAGTGKLERDVLMEGVDGAFFDFRGERERVVRLQVFLAGLSFVTSVRFFNNTKRKSLEPLEELFGP